MGYVKKQSDWIKKNNIRIGSKVVIGEFDGEYRGWEYGWVGNMTRAKGKAGIVVAISTLALRVETSISEVWNYPYFVLTPVTQEPKTTPRKDWYLLE